MIAGFQFSTFAADAPEDSWDWDIMEWSIVDAVCCMPYGLELNCDPINFSCYEDGTYGRHVTSVSQVTDDVDYIARTIFAEVINVSPRVKNAFCVAQIIENRVNSSSFPSTAKGVVSQANQFGAVGTQAFLWPSHRNYDPAFDSTDNCTQEELFMYCTFLAETLYEGKTIKTNYNNGGQDEFCPDLGSSRCFFYHISSSACPFYRYANLQGKLTPSNVQQANYYKTYPLTKSIIKLGSHVYYNY